tara:strand:+ start:1621 stop:1806 length:186 start_codon:yes stop_codon:yes gene_type:complete
MLNRHNVTDPTRIGVMMKRKSSELARKAVAAPGGWTTFNACIAETDNPTLRLVFKVVSFAS